MPLSLEDARKYLPQYLSPADTAELFAELAALPRLGRFFGHAPNDEPLQGDIWEQVQYYNFSSGMLESRRVMIVSNSCDVAGENRRTRQVFIAYSPLMRVSRFEQMLRDRGAPADAIENALNAIRQQETTTAFYVPASGVLTEDHVVLLDDIQSQPLRLFAANHAKQRLATLSQSAFWLFLLKISIHFCRSFENFARTHAVEPAAS